MEHSLDTMRAMLSLAQPTPAIEDGLRAVMHAGKSAVPLVPEVMAALRGLYAEADQFGTDARPVEQAVFALKGLMPEGHLTEAHIVTLSNLARNKRSFPNAADMAVAVLASKGRSVLPAPLKAKRATKAAAPKDALPALLESVRSRTASGLLEADKLMKRVEPERLRVTDGLFGEVQDALRHAIDTNIEKASYRAPVALLKLAELFLPSPDADRALFAHYAEHKTPILRRRARACIKRIDGVT